MSSSSRKMLQAAAGNAGGGDFYPYTVDNSVRFNYGDSAYLTRTPSSETASERKTFTISAWIKLGAEVFTQSIAVWGAGSDSASTKNDRLVVRRFDATAPADAVLEFTSWSASNQIQRRSEMKLRDLSSWYHLVVKVDTTQATASDRIKMYVNGVELTEFQDSVNPSQNYQCATNGTEPQNVGRRRPNTSTAYTYNDGYISEICIVAGTALDPTSFGQFKNGVWVPKNVSGLTFGTNGFYLDFSNSAALGTDVSGNGNNFTSSGLTSSDQMPDTPTNNFPVMNPLFGQGTMADGNLYASIVGGTASRGQTSTFGAKTGKWYVEMSYLSDTWVVPKNHFGIVPADQIDTYITGTDGIAYYGDTGAYYPGAVSYGASYGPGDILSIAVDLDNDEITFYKNGVSQGTITAYTLRDTEYLFGNWFTNSATTVVVFNFGQDSTFSGRETAGGNSDENGIGDFKYAVPSGFLALCTANLPEPTIGPNSDIKPEDCFATVLYTGNGTAIGSGGKAVTGVGFQPDMVWIKNRDAADQWMCFDSVRGATKYLSLDGSDIEVTDTESLNTFDADGFTLGNNVAVNTNTENYVAYCFKITAGFFDIQSYTGTGVAKTEAHDLGAVPKFITTKKLTTAAGSWNSYVSSLPVSDPETDFLYLDLSNAVADNVNRWNDTAPTTTVFSLGNGAGTNGSGESYIAYLFADVEGFCKTGYYAGNGSADGAFAYQGFLPDFFITKRSDIAQVWSVYDSARNPSNVISKVLVPDLPDAEVGGISAMDFVSNGVKMRDTNAARNGVGSHITLSIGTPSKYSNAR